MASLSIKVHLLTQFPLGMVGPHPECQPTVFAVPAFLLIMPFRVLVVVSLHNQIRDITATLLTEVCHDVQVEPDLQEVTLEEMRNKTANTEPGPDWTLQLTGFGVEGTNALMLMEGF